MSVMTRGGRWLAGLAGIVLGFGIVLLAATPASAHAVLVASSPAQKSTVPTAPGVVILTFSETVRAVPGKIRVIGPDGEPASRGNPTVSGSEVSIQLRSDPPQGTYLVSFRVISADSHPVSGGFTFSVGAPSTTPDLPAGSASDPVVSALVPAARYVGYAGLALLIGPVLVLLALWPTRLDRRVPTRLAWIGLGLVGGGTLAALLLQAPYTTGASLTGTTMSDIGDVLGTPFGTAHLVRLAVLVAGALLVRPVLAGRGGVADRALLAILAVIGIATWPIAGHSAASPVPLVTVLSDAAHLAGMAVWLGGLVMLFGFLLRQATEPELEAIMPIWSRWAALAVTVLLLGGTLQAMVEIGTPAALVGTAYGRLVLVKIGLFALVLGVAAMSRQMVRRRVAAQRPGRVRRLVAIEMAVAAGVLVVSSVLVQTTPGRSAEAGSQGATIYAQTLTTELYSLQVQIDPARTGNNSIHLYAYKPDGQPQPVVEWKATAALPASGVEPIDVPLLRVLDYHAIGEIVLPTPGTWEFRFTLRLSDIDQASVTATVPVA